MIRCVNRIFVVKSCEWVDLIARLSLFDEIRCPTILGQGLVQEKIWDSSPFRTS